METYEIGEIAIVVWPENPSKHNQDVEIMSNLCDSEGILSKNGVIANEAPAHKVRYLNGNVGWLDLTGLRKKKPPATSYDITETQQKGAGEWDLMPWRPEKLTKEKVL